MRVQKRNNDYQNVDLNKITNRLQKLVNEMQSDIDVILVSQKVCNALHDGVTTRELDKLAAEISMSLITSHPDYGNLAAYIVISDIHKNMKNVTFLDLMKLMNERNLITNEVVEIATKYNTEFENLLDYNKDYLFDFFGIKTLEKNYFYKHNGITYERPQDLFLRVAIGIHGDSYENIVNTYKMMSDKLFIHATPTLFNSGTPRPQLASCFLMGMNDNITDIYKTLSDCAQISKWAGGIGLWIHDIRSNGSSIRGIQGACTGIVPMLKVFNDTARYVNQEGRRPGSIAIYLSVDHPDIYDFLEMKKNTGDEEMRARDLFYAAWIPDLFMKRVKEGKNWSLFCPNDCPGLSDLYGDAYESKYLEYESAGKAKRTVEAQSLWFAICNAQIETGTPYVLYKDAVNSKCNQNNLGTIKSSNLCCEITEYTDSKEIAVCNLASICLPSFVKDTQFDFEKLGEVVKQMVINLNSVIDRSFYPVPEAAFSNKRHRPIGIGVQGLSDVYMLMRYPFDSPEASKLNAQIFETIYYYAVTQSVALAKTLGPYETFQGSPASKGVLQFDMWNVTPVMYNWDSLKEEVKTHGLRNSLLVAPMPTATTSQIMGNNECFEPITSNLYVRRTIAGEFKVLNKHLVKDLSSLGLWNQEMKDQIVYHRGSVQNINGIPDTLKKLYKTSWELSQKVIINQAADRGAFVCQSQSMNLFVPKPTLKILSSMHFYAWEKGLKTGIYYLRTKPASNPIQFTVDPNAGECTACSA